MFDFIRTIPGLTSMVVTSWVLAQGQGDSLHTQDQLRQMPLSLPEADLTSHLAILKHVVTRA